MNKLNDGFTLIELLTAVVIITILASFMVVNYQDSQRQAQQAKIKTTWSIAEGKYIEKMLGKWTLDEGTGTSARDSSDFRNTATISGATWKGENDCVSGTCLSFDGSDDFINSAAPKIANQTTISAWVKVSTMQDWMRILVWNDGTKNREIGFCSNTQKITVHSYTGAASTTQRSTSVFPLNEWKYVVFIDNGGTQSIYVDGALTSLESADSFSNPTTQGFYIGRWPDGGTTEFFNGLIDEVSIHDAVLTFSEIKKNYVAGLDKLLEKNLITKQDYSNRMVALQKNSLAKK